MKLDVSICSHCKTEIVTGELHVCADHCKGCADLRDSVRANTLRGISLNEWLISQQPEYGAVLDNIYDFAMVESLCERWAEIEVERTKQECQQEIPETWWDGGNVTH